MDDSFEFPPPKPDNEQARLRQLGSLKLEGDEQLGRFDRLVQLATLVTEAPMGWFCLVGEKRLVFQSVWHIQIDELPRDESICAYTVLHNELLVVEDLESHSFFGNQKWVDDEPLQLGAYCGAPVRGVSRPEPVGVLAVGAPDSQKFDERQRRGLRLLRDELEIQLQLHVVRDKIGEQRKKIDRLVVERDEMFRSLRGRAIDVAGALRSDARFIERISQKTEVVEAARDVIAGSETLEDIVEMAEGYVMWSRGRLKMLSSRLSELAD